MPSYKILAVIIFLCISCGSLHKKVVRKYPNGAVHLIVDYPDENDLSTCDLRSFYPNGNIWKHVTMVKGKYVDKKTTYFINGRIFQIDSLNEPCDTNISKCNGTVIDFYENGNLSSRKMIRNGVYSGLSQHYDSRGKIVKEYELINDSVKNGMYTEYHENGVVEFKANYKNDTIVGLSYYFDEKGDTSKYENNYDGFRAFPYKKWLKDGTTLLGDYSDTSQTAVCWIWFDRNHKEIKRKLSIIGDKPVISPD